MSPFGLSDEEGAFLVKLARSAITEYVKRGRKIEPPPNTPEKLFEKRGVFVTLNKLTEAGKELRGCIGYPEPILPLVEAVIDSAIHSATADPRFRPVTADELEKILVEVSVLTPLQPIKVESPREYPKRIKVGVDGLVVEWGPFKGLLLPQVPVEWGWDEEEFLSNCCIKAGLPPDAWLTKGVTIYKFQAEIFEEERPGGEVKRVPLGRES